MKNTHFPLENAAQERNTIKSKHISLFTTLQSWDNQSVMNKRSEEQRGSGSDQFQPLPFYRIKWFTLVRPPVCHVVCSNPVFKSGSLMCCSWTENRCNPGSSSNTESEALWFMHRTGGDDSCRRRSKDKRKRELVRSLVQSRWCFNRVCAVSVCCHSLSSTVPAGEGALAVPGLVLCPSIPQELCDSAGDCESRQRYCILWWLIPNSAALVSMNVVFLRSFSRSALDIYHFQNTVQMLWRRE